MVRELVLCIVSVNLKHTKHFEICIQHWLSVQRDQRYDNTECLHYPYIIEITLEIVEIMTKTLNFNVSINTFHSTTRHEPDLT